MAALELRDRDAIATKEDLIFRVFGYSHPPDSYICDAEYASAKIFRSDNPKAFRNSRSNVFYKFYEDEGWRFIQEKFPQYKIFHEMLQKRSQESIIETFLKRESQKKRCEGSLQQSRKTSFS